MAEVDLDTKTGAARRAQATQEEVPKKTRASGVGRVLAGGTVWRGGRDYSRNSGCELGRAHRIHDRFSALDSFAERPKGIYPVPADEASIRCATPLFDSRDHHPLPPHHGRYAGRCLLTFDGGRTVISTVLARSTDRP